MRSRRRWTLRTIFDRWNALRRWWKKENDPLTLVVLSKSHLEVQKVHLSSRSLKWLKWGLVSSLLLFTFSFVFLLLYLMDLPNRQLLKNENYALRNELNNLHYHMDTLQSTVNRMSRFDQKLRALTEVDKEFAKIRGPRGQGGGEITMNLSDEVFDLGESEISSETLQIDDEARYVLDRRSTFMVEKIYSWMRRLYKSSELESQSLEELFEVLKGREIQLAATPSILPVRGWVTSHYGHRLDPFTGRRKMHRGMDVAARKGAPVVSPAEGTVSFAGKNGSYGNTVMVFHGYGVSTLYAHMEDVLVRPGQRVSRGDILGTIGSSGRSTGTHLHYEVTVHGVSVNPRKFVLDKSF